MSTQAPTSDAGLINLLRVAGALGVADLADAMEVTPTAVRQRLTRLLRQNTIQRETTRHGRGRPKHRYWLTEKGMLLTNSNFADLATALWKKCQNEPSEQRCATLRRIGRALASGYAEKISGQTPSERAESLGQLIEQCRASSRAALGTVPQEHASPGPESTEQGQNVQGDEQRMFSELLRCNAELMETRFRGV